jgi:3-phenylpropionate/cinnamic acid dioxygenase small subunit
LSESDVIEAAADASLERAITALIYKAARLSDERAYIRWMELFTDDGRYGAITHENFTSSGLYLFMDVGRRALHERAAFQMGLWQAPRGKTLHLVSNIEVRSGETETTASAVSNFIMTRTADMEHAKLHACGQYRDAFERRNGAWLFKSRIVIVDSNVLPPEFTELL